MSLVDRIEDRMSIYNWFSLYGHAVDSKNLE